MAQSRRCGVNFISLNALASFACQGGNPPPRREQDAPRAGRSGEGARRPGCPERLSPEMALRIEKLFGGLRVQA
jgi:hypothetical protein